MPNKKVLYCLSRAGWSRLLIVKETPKQYLLSNGSRVWKNGLAPFGQSGVSDSKRYSWPNAEIEKMYKKQVSINKIKNYARGIIKESSWKYNSNDEIETAEKHIAKCFNILLKKDTP